MTPEAQPESPKPYSTDELESFPQRMHDGLVSLVDLDRLRATAEHIRDIEARVQRYEAPPTMEEADDIHDIYLEHKARCTDLAMCEDDTGSQEDWHGCHGHVAFELLERFLSGRRESEGQVAKLPKPMTEDEAESLAAKAFPKRGTQLERSNAFNKQRVYIRAMRDLGLIVDGRRESEGEK